MDGQWTVAGLGVSLKFSDSGCFVGAAANMHETCMSESAGLESAELGVAMI